MKKKIISVLAILLVISIYASTAASAVSARASLYLSSYCASIYPSGSGNMSVYFDVVGTGTMDQIGVLSIRLQQKPSGSSTWTTVQTYSHVNYTDMLADNTYYHSSSVSYSGISGYSYRAYVTVWAGKDGDGDSREILTASEVA